MGKNQSKLVSKNDSEHTSSTQQHKINSVLMPLNQPAMTCTGLFPEHYKIVEQSLAYDVVVTPSSNIHTIFHNNEAKIYQDALAIARDDILTAGLLDVLEAKVKANPSVLLPRIKITKQISGVDHTFEGTLEQLAVISLDYTMKSRYPTMDGEYLVYEGMAERLRMLREKLLPDTIQLAVDQARLASPVEDQKETRTREAQQEKVLDNVFEKIKQKNISGARAVMIKYINETRPATITDNRYFLNLLRFIPMAFDKLEDRNHELRWGWYSAQADQFCFTTAGIIAKALPFKLRRIFIKSGTINRKDDVSDEAFLSARFLYSPTYELGVNCFYDNQGLAYRSTSWMDGGGVAAYNMRWPSSRKSILSVYQQLHQCSKIYAALEQSTDNTMRLTQ